MTDRTKNPSSIVYWNDLANDEALKTCSRSARGLWTTELLPMAAASAEPGVVQIGARPCVWDGDLPALLANSGGGTAEQVLELLADLVHSGAAGVDERGRIFNRRMVREHQIKMARSAAGKAGMRSRWGEGADNRPVTNTLTNGVTNGGDDGREQVPDLFEKNGPSRPDSEYQGDNKPITSSLLHDSKTLSNGESHTVGPRAKRSPSGDPKGSRLPDGWEPPEELKEWTRAEIAKAGSRVSAGAELQKFRDHWKAATGAKARKADWLATWRNWIREAIRREGKSNGSSNYPKQKPHNTSLGRKAAYAAALSSLGARDTDTEGDGS